MATYSINGAPGVDSNVTFRPVTDGTKGLALTLWLSGVAAAVTNRSLDFLNRATIGGDTARTSEKFNSRSATASGEYINAGVSTLSRLILCKTPRFGSPRWIARRGCSPFALERANSECLSLDTGLDTSQMSVVEDGNANRWTRGRARRSRKAGFWNLSGNIISRIATSGGGAFRCIYPVFHNDLEWVVPSAWKNVHEPQNYSVFLEEPPAPSGPPTGTLALFGVGI